jgi:X-X-X-Leu-X-X-Gly heptad repeat protein
VGVLAVGVVGSEVGQRAAGWVYDKALAPAGKAIGHVAEDAAGVVADGAGKLKDGAGKVVGALNPFG